MTNPVLDVRSLTKHFPVKRGKRQFWARARQSWLLDQICAVIARSALRAEAVSTYRALSAPRLLSRGPSAGHNGDWSDGCNPVGIRSGFTVIPTGFKAYRGS